MSPVFSTIALALALANGVHAFFRINCDNIQRGRIDPLVNPGALAAHSHSIVGGSSMYDQIISRARLLTGDRYRCKRDIQLSRQLPVHLV